MTHAAFKYPKTMHLPFSPGLQNDDRKMDSTVWLENSEVVVTEKMDGEYASELDAIYALAADEKYLFSRNQWFPTTWRSKNGYTTAYITRAVEYDFK